MELRQFVADDDAVSPVIGVILMVAITVILAAVIGAFVLGFGGSTTSAPSATWDASNTTVNDSSAVAFEHAGGDTVDDATTLSISEVDDTKYYNGSSTVDVENGASVSTGDVIFTEDFSPDEYTLVWEASGGDSSQELSTFSP